MSEPTCNHPSWGKTQGKYWCLFCGFETPHDPRRAVETVHELESKLDGRTALLKAIREDLVFRRQLKPDGECVIPLSSSVWERLKEALSDE